MPVANQEPCTASPKTLLLLMLPHEHLGHSGHLSLRNRVDFKTDFGLLFSLCRS